MPLSPQLMLLMPNRHVHMPCQLYIEQFTHVVGVWEFTTPS